MRIDAQDVKIIEFVEGLGLNPADIYNLEIKIPTNDRVTIHVDYSMTKIQTGSLKLISENFELVKIENG